MDLQLKNKKVFISGSTAGIGFGVARIFLQEGAEVIINGRTTSSVNRAIEKLSTKYPSATISGMALDFSNQKEVLNSLEQLNDIDILINNVGIYKAKSFFETTDEDWETHFEVNVMSGVRLSRHCLPKMLEKNWGRILFVSSECASIVPENLIAYSTSKASLHAISRGLAELTKGTGVTINTIMPGSTMTEGAQEFLSNVAKEKGISPSEVEIDFFNNDRSSSLLQRFASVEEIANTIVYLSSPLSVATNGSSVKLDGGSIGGIL